MSASASPNRRRRQPLHRPVPTGICRRTGKIRWPTRDGARHHIRHLKSMGGPDGTGLQSYRCKAGCGDWHVGHPKKEDR